MLNKLPRKSLADDIVALLRRLIISGELKPGEHLRETVIADQISTSRSPVREAFMQLEEEGLIVSIPNQGRFVRVFSEEDIKDIFGLRTAIEALAAEIVLSEGKLQAEDFEALEDLIERQKEAVRDGENELLTELDLAFHEYVCEKADRERLFSVWRSLRHQIQVLFYQRFHNHWGNIPEGVVPDHIKILDALRSGNSNLAAELHKTINDAVVGQILSQPPDSE